MLVWVAVAAASPFNATLLQGEADGWGLRPLEAMAKELENGKMSAEQAVKNAEGVLPNEVTQLLKGSSTSLRAAPDKLALKHVDTVNKLIVGEKQKLDISLLECVRVRKDIKRRLRTTKAEQTALGAQIARAGATRTKATGDVPKMIRMIDDMRNQVLQSQKDCKHDEGSNKLRLQRTKEQQQGAEEMAKLVGQCLKEKKASFLHICEDASNTTHVEQVGHVSTLVMRTARGALELDEDGKTLASVALDANLSAHLRRLWADPAGGGSLGGAKTPVLGASGAGPRNKMRNKCILSASVSCRELVDRVDGMQGELEMQVEDITAQMVKNQQECESFKHAKTSEIQQTNALLNQAQEDLADSTGQVNAVQQTLGDKEREYREVTKELKDFNHQCESQVKESSMMICSLKVVRGQILTKVTGSLPVVMDCEVGPWSPGECSKTCGTGGRMLFSRPQVQEAGKHGSACPPLQVLQKCNDRPCPVDCQLGDWSGWGGCSKECGGGLKTRVRPVLMQSQNGGLPCSEIQQSQSCNVQGCDKDCELGDWGPWTGCSRACRFVGTGKGGLDTRKRKIHRPATGSGRCPTPTSKARLNMVECNMNECPAGVRCASNVDVIVLIDGSGSVKQRGFDLQKQFAKQLITQMEMDANRTRHARVSVISYTGYPKWYNTSSPVKIVQGFTNDKAGTIAKIDQLEWPGIGTMTERALLVAKSVMEAQTKKTRQTVVLLLTDGKPRNSRKVEHAARALRAAGARLVVAPVGCAIQSAVKEQEFGKWASLPPRENVLMVNTFCQLPGQVDRFVSVLCPQLGNPTPETSIFEPKLPDTCKEEMHLKCKSGE
mmetsp:Transcript_32636/g.68983  ORF Transcript_32636/g.68983 Transcript_32636/m.68983 type:complete len:833 (+) Transcript_32636:156-2654(+)|eukprot:CAMPEP_0204355642 /NCGR_PEP_ID=MMETSP0469-20131031/34293_1 /ASSEMBLY_ACC=CAM_ASM_000384 /TAXON_ID=2969 /ORGANISM="Oxyrrhis marina" /LENGTH=832 /DNA_ID=CAMNT_0051342929 /DNA_START=149 /DNA_END=2647 /DNA_ORIENTATION=-